MTTPKPTPPPLFEPKFNTREAKLARLAEQYEREAKAARVLDDYTTSTLAPGDEDAYVKARATYDAARAESERLERELA